MEDKELESLIALIMSWEEANLQLAVSILHGNPSLKDQFMDQYGLLFELIGNPEIEVLETLPYWISRSVCQAVIPFQENLIPLFESMPIYELQMRKKGLERIPWWVFHLKKMSILTLPQNEIKEIPAEILQLENLTKINLENNLLESLPENIGEMISLEKLYLDFNHIKELPESIGQLSNLFSLCLEDSDIRKLPKSMKNLHKLSWFSMEKTPLGKYFGLTYGEYISVEDDRFFEYLSIEIKEDEDV